MVFTGWAWVSTLLEEAAFPCHLHLLGSMGIMEKKMETQGPFRGTYRVIGIIQGLYGDNGKQNGNYYHG